AHQPLLLQAVVDERLEQLERHLLRQAALGQLELRPHHDDRTAGVVDALAEQVLAEAALLALEGVGERLQGPVVRALEHAAAAAVVEEGVDGLLEHALLVAHDDLRGAQLQQLLQPVVAVDDAPVEVVEVAGGEPAAVERHEGPQLGRDDRDDVQDHPFRAVARLAEGVDHLEPLGRLEPADLARLGAHDDAQLLGQLVDVDALQQLLDGLGAHLGGEGLLGVLVAQLAEPLLGEQLPLLDLRLTGIDDDVALEVEDALEVAQADVQEVADAARQPLEEPDVRHRAGELDVAHALAAHPRTGDLDAALVADDAAVLHPLVLAAQALPVRDRTEDLGAEEAVALRLESPVVDRLGLGDLTIAPGTDLLRRSDRDLDRVEILERLWLVKAAEWLQLSFLP